MKVLVTGANGFIGRNVIERLADQDIEFLTLDRAGPNMSVHHDLISPLDWWSPSGVDAVFHLAADSGVRSFNQSGFENNVQATENVLKWATANNVRMVVFGSSSSVYGNQMRMEETAVCTPLSPYAQSKFASERLINCWARSANRVAVTLRIFNAIGRYQRKDMFPSRICDHLKKVSEGQPDELKVFGSRLRSWTHVGDVVNGFWSALQTFHNSKLGTRLTFNLGTNAMMTQRDLIEMFSSRTKIQANIVQEEPNPLDVQRTKADMVQFTSIFGWAPNHRNVNLAVDELIEEYAV